MCREEAHEQFLRDKKVDNSIMHVLRRRYEDCLHFEHPHQDDTDPDRPCFHLKVSK